jgi:hypothetical protein
MAPVTIAPITVVPKPLPPATQVHKLALIPSSTWALSNASSFSPPRFHLRSTPRSLLLLRWYVVETVISYNRRRPHSPPSNCQSRANSRLDSPLSTVYHCLLLPLWWPLWRWTIPVIPRPADSSPSMPSMPRAFTTHQLKLSTTSPTPHHHHSSPVESHHHGGPSTVSLSSPFRLNRVPQPLLQL